MLRFLLPTVNACLSTQKPRSLVHSFLLIIATLTLLSTNLSCKNSNKPPQEIKTPESSQNAGEPANENNFPTEETEPKQPPADSKGRYWYQVVNVDIPENSATRKFDKIKWPPALYLVIKQNGTELGKTDSVRGWSVDYAFKTKNQFPIRHQENMRYSIEIWDDGFWGDTNIINFTQVSGTEFDLVVEQKTPFDLPNSRIRVTFQRVKPPEGY
jgi:hypothetical protein